MKLSYEVDGKDGTQKRDLPFVIGVLGDFTGRPAEPLPKLRDRKFVDVNSDNFDSVLDGMRPHLNFTTRNELSEEFDFDLQVDLNFKAMDDFEPDNVACQVRPLHRLRGLRQQMTDLLGRITTDSRLEEVACRFMTDADLLGQARSQLAISGEPDVMASIITKALADCGWSGDGSEPWDRERTTTLLGSFVAYIADNGAYSTEATAAIRRTIAEIEHLISIQIRIILHHPDFQKLESGWRGLRYLLQEIGDGSDIKLRVLNVSKRELLRDLQRAPEFDQSALYRHVAREFTSLGGQPFNLLVGVHEFGRHPEDIELLEKISNVAASAHCVFVSAAAPDLLQLSSFRDLNLPRWLTPIFESTIYAKWKSFRQSDDSRYVGLVLPRILLRGPYAIERDDFYGSLPYTERIDTSDELLWGNAAFAVASVIAREFRKESLGNGVTGPEASGMIGGLPECKVAFYLSEEVWSAVTEVAIDDQRGSELSDLGFIAVYQRKDTGEAVLYDLPSCHRVRQQSDPKQTMPQLRSTARLENVLVVSRFAHFLKCMLRDKIGKFATATEWQKYLYAWMQTYVVTSDPVDGAYAPLEAASIALEGARNERSFYYPYYSWYGPDYLGRVRVIATLTPQFRNRPKQGSLRVLIGLPQIDEVRE